MWAAGQRRCDREQARLTSPAVLQGLPMSSVQGSGCSGSAADSALAQQVQILVAKKRLDAARSQAQAALQLLQPAAPHSGTSSETLDVTA